MWRHRKTLTLAGAALAASLAGLGASAGAAAAASTPSILTTDFACNSNGVCTPGPGDVGVAYSTSSQGSDADIFGGTITVASGSLPPGLQIEGSGNEGGYGIGGTPTAAGTYDFTLQITNQGASSTQAFFITVGTGTADRLVASAATLTNNKNLSVPAYDPNIGATYTVYVTATGEEIGTMAENTGAAPLFLEVDVLGASGQGGIPDVSEGVTIKDSLGSSANLTVTLVNRKY